MTRKLRKQRNQFVNSVLIEKKKYKIIIKSIREKICKIGNFIESKDLDLSSKSFSHSLKPAR